MSKLLSPTYNGNTWHPDRPPMKVSSSSGTTHCSNCRRFLIITAEGACLCCGKEV